MRDHLLSIQALRAVAALLVLVFHVVQTWRDDFGLFAHNIFPVGANGVDIFFVISGFIMCYTTASPDERSPFKFACKRVARIVPLYFALTLVVFALAGAKTASHTDTGIEGLVKSLLFIPYQRADGNVYPVLFLGWTLNYEMFFYLIFTLALFVPRFAQRIVVAVMIALVASRLFIPPQGIAGHFYTNNIILDFVWGCLLFGLWRKWPDVFARIWPLAVVGAILLGVQAYAEQMWPRSLAAGLPAALIVAVALGLRLPANAARTAMVRLGDASYSIYLVHPFVVKLSAGVLIRFFGANPLTASVHLVIALVATCAISLVLFAWFERPVNDWLRGVLLGARSIAPKKIPA
ncbi:MAG: acyltransferase [Alphaproteobacteria bacterium]